MRDIVELRPPSAALEYASNETTLRGIAGKFTVPKSNLHTIQITFSDGVKEFKAVNGAMKVSTAIDNFCLSASGLKIQYARSKKQNHKQAFSSIRLSRIKEIWLLYYSITGKFPDVREIHYTCSGKTDTISASEVNLPVCPECSDRPIIDSEIATRFYDSTDRLSLIASVSYLFASRQAVDVMSRFRYLWSSFNCLYKMHPCEDRSEYLRARALIEAIPENETLLSVKRQFWESAIDLDSPSWRWNDFLRGFGALKISEKKKGEICVNGNAPIVLSDADERMLRVLMSRSAYSRWKKLPTNKNPIVQRLADLKSKADSNCFLFVFSSYLYWLRCDTMHGNSPYPVFMSTEQRTLLKALCDSLESLVPLCIAFLLNQ